MGNFQFGQNRTLYFPFCVKILDFFFFWVVVSVTGEAGKIEGQCRRIGGRVVGGRRW